MKKEIWQNIKKNQLNNKAYLTYLIFLIDIILICASWELSFKTVLFTIISKIFLVLSLVHLYLIMHEASHSAISSNKFINDLIGHICGWIVIMPYLARTHSHLLHHTWTGHPVRYPANKRMIEKFSVMTPKQAQKLEFIWRNWIPAIVLNDRIGLWKSPFNKSMFTSQSKSQTEIIFNYTYLFLYISLLCILYLNNQLIHFINWFLPAFLILAIIEELVNLPHHAETPLLKTQDKALPYWEQGIVTHSCKTIPVWSKFILLNFNLHTAHHFFPNAAWYDLPIIHEKIESTSPDDLTDRKYLNELKWSLINRKRSLLSIMGHYFDKIQTNSGVVSKQNSSF